MARIPWPVVFAKAYALVAAGSPPLRRVYVKPAAFRRAILTP